MKKIFISALSLIFLASCAQTINETVPSADDTATFNKHVETWKKAANGFTLEDPEQIMSIFADSLTSAQYGRDRETFLNNLSSKMSSATELPTIRELEGLWYELQREMVAGSEVVSFNANVITLDGETKLDTGFVGSAAFDYEGASRSTFITGILSSANHGSYPSTSLAPDGYPYVSSTLTTATSSFYKDSDTSRALVEVFEPLSTSNWGITVGCPYYTLSCGTEDEYLCSLTQQHETLRKIVFTNLDTLY